MPPDPLPKAECLETRIKDGLKWRRYRTSEGAVYTTYEVPTEIFQQMVAAVAADPKFADYTQSWYREQQYKEKVALAERLLQEGCKPAAVANEVGFALTTIRRIKKTLQEKTWQPQNQK